MNLDLFADPSIVGPPRVGEYRTLMADPPWLEAGGGEIKRGADRHYPLMKTDDICALPVRNWMKGDAHLYLWVTNNFLPDGLRVMSAWGFEYKTIVTWMKDRAGLGQYFRGITEHCLFGVRGSIPYRLTDDGHRLQGLTGFFEAPRAEHSAKPAQMREMVERVSPGPYLEMFARQPAPGWDVWGNECTGERLSA
jgi:N6-adenosine-specific RNA methylase IME4